MCEFSGKLVAWIDHELAQDEAAAVEPHLQACAECRNCVAEFERVSREFEAYCEALAESESGNRAVRREPILWAAAAAILLAAFLVYPRRHVAPIPDQANAISAASKSSPDSPRSAAIQPAPDEVGAVASGMSTVRPRRQRVHANRVLAKRGAACCSLTTMSGATANAPAAATPSLAPQNATWFGNEPSVQIAISAAAIFPPGALPDGIDFVADLSIGADGSVQQVRLQPQVSELERRSSKR